MLCRLGYLLPLGLASNINWGHLELLFAVALTDIIMFTWDNTILLLTVFTPTHDSVRTQFAFGI